MSFKLYYNSVTVGSIDDPFDDQGTWFGRFTSHLPKVGSDLERFPSARRIKKVTATFFTSADPGERATFDRI